MVKPNNVQKIMMDSTVLGKQYFDLFMWVSNPVSFHDQQTSKEQFFPPELQKKICKITIFRCVCLKGL